MATAHADHRQDKTDAEYKGNLTSKELKNGPLESRKCTDVFCLILFLSFWAGMVVIAIIAFDTGKPKALTHPYDQLGGQCGLDDNAEFPYLYFIKEGEKFRANNTVCVKTCPGQELECSPNYNKNTSMTPCGSINVYETNTFIRRICVPKNQTLFNIFKSSSDTIPSNLMENVNDLKSTWWMVIVVALIALVIGFLYLFLIKYCAGVLVWGTLIALTLIFAAVGVLCVVQQQDINVPDMIEKLTPGQKKAIGFTFIGLAVLMVVLICCLRKTIGLSVAILKTAAEFIEDEFSILIVPPLFFFISLVFYSFWVLTFIYILSTNSFTQNRFHRPYPHIEYNTQSNVMAGYYFFGLLWNHFFLVALCQFFIASATCLWYFDQGIAHTGRKPILTSIKRSFFHLGSVAYGSFLIAVLTAIRVVLAYLEKKIKKIDKNGNLGFIVKCCGCYMACFDKFLKFINMHAYIQIAMTGAGFCEATQEAFYLATRNAARFGLVQGFSQLFLFLGKVLIAVSSTGIGYLILTQTSLSQSITSPIPITIVCGVMAWLIAHVFMSIYGVSANSIVHCFAMDEEIHDGDPRFAPELLREFMESHSHTKKLLI